MSKIVTQVPPSCLYQNISFMLNPCDTNTAVSNLIICTKRYSNLIVSLLSITSVTPKPSTYIYLVRFFILSIFLRLWSLTKILYQFSKRNREHPSFLGFKPLLQVENVSLLYVRICRSCNILVELEPTGFPGARILWVTPPLVPCGAPLLLIPTPPCRLIFREV